ncbi:bone morphogenetic protein 1-like [Microplitis mediator]|uniref:bone morphogenetic protein 1-like n=1 Tax=Microplitis mediator TaxID=375433 RepID=UPI0025524BF2|nr:bone morphogenetic protein 1-like [Microplitis mediator]
MKYTAIGHGLTHNTSEFQEKQSVNKNRRSLATNDNDNLWDEGIIPYEIDNSYTGQQRKLIKQAMRHWEQSTCLKFFPRIKELDKHYVVFAKQQCGCCSFVGKQLSAMQILSMADNCMSLGMILHELGHTIGLHHEHSRPDRDKYVEVLNANIMIGEERNFAKESENNSTTLGQAYDYDSIMHYPGNGSSKRLDLDTIRPLMKINGKLPILRKRNNLSRGDIVTTNLLYHCLSTYHLSYQYTLV